MKVAVFQVAKFNPNIYLFSSFMKTKYFLQTSLVTLFSSSLLFAQVENGLKIEGWKLKEAGNQTTDYRLQSTGSTKPESRLRSNSIPISNLQSFIFQSDFPSSSSYLGVTPKLMMNPSLEGEEKALEQFIFGERRLSSFNHLGVSLPNRITSSVTVQITSQQTIQLNHTTGKQSGYFIQSAPPQEVGSERLPSSSFTSSNQPWMTISGRIIPPENSRLSNFTEGNQEDSDQIRWQAREKADELAAKAEVAWEQFAMSTEDVDLHYADQVTREKISAEEEWNELARQAYGNVEVNAVNEQEILDSWAQADREAIIIAKNREAEELQEKERWIARADADQQTLEKEKAKQELIRVAAAYRSKNLSSQSTEAAMGFVTPVLESSGMPYTFRALRSEAPCPSSASATLKTGSKTASSSDYLIASNRVKEVTEAAAKAGKKWSDLADLHKSVKLASLEEKEIAKEKLKREDQLANDPVSIKKREDAAKKYFAEDEADWCELTPLERRIYNTTVKIARANVKKKSIEEKGRISDNHSVNPSGECTSGSTNLQASEAQEAGKAIFTASQSYHQDLTVEEVRFDEETDLDDGLVILHDKIETISKQMCYEISSSSIPVSRLNNGGNDCFINSSLQLVKALGLTVPSNMLNLNKFLNNELNADDCRSLRNEIANDVLRDSDDFRNVIYYGKAQSQQDAAAFLRLLLEKINAPQAYFQNIIIRVGDQTDVPREITERILSLGLPEHDGINMQEIVDNFLQDQVPRENTNIIKEDATLKEPVPQSLVVSVKRFGFDYRANTGTKRQDIIEGVLNTIILPCEDGEEVTYEPQAIICHVDSNAVNSGHYICYRKEENVWWKFNDLVVTKATDGDLYETIPQNCYVISYVRIHEGASKPVIASTLWRSSSWGLKRSQSETEATEPASKKAKFQNKESEDEDDSFNFDAYEAALLLTQEQEKTAIEEESKSQSGSAQVHRNVAEQNKRACKYWRNSIEARAKGKADEADTWQYAAQGLSRAAAQTLKAIRAEKNGEFKLSQDWNEAVEQNRKASEYFEKAIKASMAGEKDKGVILHNAGCALLDQAKKICKSVEAEVNKKTEVANNWSNAAQQMKDIVKYFDKGVETYDSNKDESESWSDAGLALLSAAKQINKSIEAYANGKTEEAKVWREVVQENQHACEHYTKAAEAYAVGKKIEGNNWHDVGTGRLYAVEQLEEAIVEEANGKSEIAKTRREIAQYSQKSCEFLVTAYTKKKEQEENKSWIAVADALRKVTEQLSKAIEAEVSGNSEVATHLKETVQHHEKSSEYYIKSAIAYAAGKKDEGQCWFYAGKALVHTLNQEEKSMEAEAEGKLESAILWKEASEKNQESSKMFASSAREYVEGREDEGKERYLKGKKLLEDARRLAAAAENPEKARRQGFVII
ncbi:MAG: hypothetical protein A3F67_05355 [Verrucomicrobia bacterium RIFCSPHIGHO2_12_FULL_41_10]|nr:MAG: hypothetical protein A3F67_05355 [Verrucomicrobia bacterium RIFCSPHIGHO2_12_FULL_41_10]